MAKSEFSEGKKNVEDAKYEKAHGKKGEEVSQGKEGLVKQINSIINNQLIHTLKPSGTHPELRLLKTSKVKKATTPIRQERKM